MQQFGRQAELWRATFLSFQSVREHGGERLLNIERTSALPINVGCYLKCPSNLCIIEALKVQTDILFHD